MTLLHLSDTHGKHKELKDLPSADIIVHTGDFTYAGGEDEAMDFMNWFSDLPYAHKIFIAGNHDLCMYGADRIEGLPDNVHYLCGTGVTINGYHFFGIPMFAEDCADGTFDKMIRSIPTDTEILVTHTPPQGILDYALYSEGYRHSGDVLLAEQLRRLPNLRYHLFGHDHNNFGVLKQRDVVYSNAALLTKDYELIHQPRLFMIR
jgi:3',5'-cyclic AMP phosphodiesterase CpdA